MAFKFSVISPNATYQLDNSVVAVDEGNQVTITLNTSGVQKGQSIPYTISGTNITLNDFAGLPSLTGNFVVDNNQAYTILTANADLTTEGQETFTVTLENGATTSVIINDTSVSPPSYPQSLQTVLTNPNIYDSAGGADYFGSAVAASDSYIVVGAYGESDTGGSASGVVYVYDAVTGTLVRTLANPNTYNTSVSDQFGWSVGISGNIAIVGALLEDDAGGSASGAVYIFDVSTGNLLKTLTNPNAYGTTAGDEFGWAVAISGNYAIVGAPLEDDAAGNSSGKAYIFDVSTGNLLWTLNNPNPYSTSTSDQFGIAVAISGSYAVVGTPYEDTAAGNAVGNVYVYDVTTGTLLRTLTGPTAGSSYFGFSVGISGNYVISGAYNVADTTTGSGKAYVHNAATGALVWTWNNPNAYGTTTSDFFGYSVAISGNYAVVGAYQEDDAGNTSSGKAYIFDITTGTLIHTLNNPNAYGTSAADNFGKFVAINNNSVVVAAPGELNTTRNYDGVAYKFTLAGVLSNTLANPSVWATSANDYFGYSVASSGNYFIVGAYYDGDATGNSSGKAYIYDNTTGQLVNVLTNPSVTGTGAGDHFGWSVAMSGNYAVVGAPGETYSTSVSAGAIYVYNVTTGALLRSITDPNYSGGSYVSDYFGYSVGISGNNIIAGAYQEDPAGVTNAGVAYLIDASTGSVLHTLIGSGGYYGYSVAISGNYAIVGAPQMTYTSNLNSGLAYIYDVTTGNLLWTLNNPNSYGTQANDYFGWSVAISGDYAIVGAKGESDASGLSVGKAYIFNVTTGALAWTLSDPNAYGTSPGDYFGWAVAISGNYAIVGAHGDAAADGSLSGAAYVFDVSTGALIKTFTNPNAYGTSANDWFGCAVAISNGYAVVGAYQEDDAMGLNSGKAYIFH